VTCTSTTLPTPMRLRGFTFVDADRVRRPAGYRSRVRLDDGTEGIVASFYKCGDGELSRLVLVKDDGTTLVLTPQDGFSITHLLAFCVPRVEPAPRVFKFTSTRIAPKHRSGGVVAFNPAFVHSYSRPLRYTDTI